VVGSGPDNGHHAVFVCVRSQISVKGVVLTNHRHADVAQALGLAVSTSRAKRVRCTLRPASIVETPSSAPPCLQYQTTAEGALRREDEALRLISTPPDPAVNTSRHQDRVVAPEHCLGRDQPCVIAYGQPSEIESRGEPIETILDRPSPGEDELYAGLESPNTATKEATRHQEGSDNLFEADLFEPNVVEASPQSLYLYAEQDDQILEVGSTSPAPWIRDRTQTTLVSQHVPQDEGLGLDRQSCTNQSETRRLRRRRSSHDSYWTVVKRRRVLDHMRVSS